MAKSKKLPMKDYGFNNEAKFPKKGFASKKKVASMKKKPAKGAVSK